MVPGSGSGSEGSLLHMHGYASDDGIPIIHLKQTNLSFP